MATLLLREASDDITEASRVRLLVEDLRAVRQNKLHNMLNITSRIVSDELPKEISHAEMNVVRPFMVKALGAFDRYDVAGGGAEAPPPSQTRESVTWGVFCGSFGTT